MRTNHSPRLSAIPATVDDPDETDLLMPLRDCVLSLLDGFERAPKALRVRTHEVEIEVEWPEQQPGAGAGTALPGDVTFHVEPDPALPGHEYLTAGNVGVFYRSPEPGAKPFVELGDTVTPGQQVGIIEAMKLMIPVEASAAGKIVELLATDGAAVEYGEKLFAIEPAGG